VEWTSGAWVSSSWSGLVEHGSPLPIQVGTPPYHSSPFTKYRFDKGLFLLLQDKE